MLPGGYSTVIIKTSLPGNSRRSFEVSDVTEACGGLTAAGCWAITYCGKPAAFHARKSDVNWSLVKSFPPQSELVICDTDSELVCGSVDFIPAPAPTPARPCP
jgi:hypothetical protein